ncbi:hypothetical protein AB3N58_12235 [Leptospira sp. WS60.C2]
MKQKYFICILFSFVVHTNCNQNQKSANSDLFLLGLSLFSQKNIVFQVSDLNQTSGNHLRSIFTRDTLPSRFLGDNKVNHSVGCKQAQLNLYSIVLFRKDDGTRGNETVSNASYTIFDGNWIDNGNGGRMKVSVPIVSGESFNQIAKYSSQNLLEWKSKEYDRIGFKIWFVKCKLDESRIANSHNQYISYNVWNESEVGSNDPQHGHRNILESYPFDDSVSKVNTRSFFISPTTGYMNLNPEVLYSPRIHRNVGTEALELNDHITNPFWDLLTAPYTDRAEVEYIDPEYSAPSFRNEGLLVLDLPEGNRDSLVLNLFTENNFVYQTELANSGEPFSPIHFLQFEKNTTDFQNFYLNPDFIATHSKYLENWILPAPLGNQPDPNGGRDIGYFMPKFGFSLE